MTGALLAEAVSLDPGELLVVLIVALLVLALAVATVVLGFVLARRAALGSTSALAGWIAILVVEGLFCLGSVAALLDGQFSLGVLVPLAIVATQVYVFVSTRRNG